MIIEISLATGSRAGAASNVQVASTTHVDVADPRWQTSLVDTVAYQAQEGARRLVAELTPALPAYETPFTPLADIAPRISPARS
jgi:hypothetical protein